MNLYEINEEILKCVDMETGEIVEEEKLAELQLAKRRQVESWWKADDEEFYYTVTYYLLDMDNEKELFSDSKKSLTEIVDYLRAIKE